MTWYQDAIEEPIRGVVHHLRDNGFNTICSCGHKMEIDLILQTDGEMKRLHDCLFNAGFRDYEVSTRFSVKRGLPWFTYTTVKITSRKNDE